jgi:DnaK suppressor protein
MCDRPPPGSRTLRRAAVRLPTRGPGYAERVSDDLDLDDVRRTLEARQGVLHGRIAELGFGKRIGDGTLEAVSRLTEVGVGGSLEVSEERIERALAKLDAGTYGACDRCGRPIAPARLRAAPESVLCIDCARLR